MGKLIDLTGKTFGRLTVIKRIEDYIQPNGMALPVWLCQCSCRENNFVKIKGINLRNGDTTSCGCFHKERIKIANKKYNQFILTGEYGIGLSSNSNRQFYFDLNQFEILKSFCWREGKDGYIETANNDKHIYLHRLLTGTTEEYDLVIDHINHNVKDNRLENLRICTRQQNNFNRGIKENNTSGVTGVYFDKKNCKWVAQLVVNYKNVFLGRYDNKEDAIKVRKAAELKYFGDYAYDNAKVERGVNNEN